MNDKSGLEQLLDQLDHWRNFAAYKLEQRIDPLIGMCLPDILNGNIGTTICRIIIPEFPFPTEILLPEYNKGSTRSLRCDRIDFAAFCPRFNVLYLIELKTDNTSISEKQLDKLQKIAVKSETSGVVYEWMEALKEVAKTSSKARKYIPIFYELEKWKFVVGIDGDIDAVVRAGNVGYKKILGDIKINEFCGNVSIVPVLIAPELCIDNLRADEGGRHNRIKLITLGDAADALLGNDELQKLLKEKLKKWNAPATSSNSENQNDKYL